MWPTAAQALVGTGPAAQAAAPDSERQPLTAKDLAFALPPSAWRMVGWREGSRGELSGRFAAVRVRPSHRDYWRAEPHPEEWLLVEWPEAKEEPTKYWLSTLPGTAPIEELVATAKLRWRMSGITRSSTLLQELGLDHYEGRGWRGFHHHATLCVAAYGFLVRERSLPPSGPLPRPRACATLALVAPRASRAGPSAINPHSIASVRRLLAIALARRLPRCPCCQLPVRPSVPVPRTSLL